MEINGKTGLIVAAIAGGAALLASKSKKVEACPAGSKRDAASGQCVYIQTVEVQVAAPGGAQKNTGGDGDTGAVLSYDYNMQARSQWEKEAAQYANDATISAEFKALMSLIQASKEFPDTPEGKAAVDKLDKQIQQGFANLDALRVKNAALKADKEHGDTRLALAVHYDAAKASARDTMTKIIGDLRATFLAAYAAVQTYTNAQQIIANTAADIRTNYDKVVGVVQDWDAADYARTRWPDAMYAALPARGAFADAAGRLAAIAVPTSTADAVLLGAPLAIKQLAAIRANFKLANSWGLTAAELKNVANPLAAAAHEINRLEALTNDMGALYCGRTAAILTVIPILTKLELLLNRLEIMSRAFDAGLRKISGWVDHAQTATRGVNGGDGLMSSTQMRKMLDALNSGALCSHYCTVPNCSAPENRSYNYIVQQAAEWLPKSCYGQVGSFLPPANIADLASIGVPAPVTMTMLFQRQVFGLPAAADVQAQLQEIFAALTKWQNGCKLLTSERENAAPDVGEFKNDIDLSMVGYCPAVSAMPVTEPDYNTLVDKPDLSLIVSAPLATDADVQVQSAAQSMKSAMSASFAGLRGLRGASVSVRESRSTIGRGSVGTVLRVGAAEQVAVRGSNGGLGRLGGGHGLGRAGLGDPIQSILSPLAGLNGRKH